MLGLLLKPLVHLVKRCVELIQERVDKWTAPASNTPIIGALNDLTRTRTDLMAENAILRQQLVVLRRQVKRPRFGRWDRLILLWLANKARSWKSAVLILQPDTLLRWHREGFGCTGGRNRHLAKPKRRSLLR